MISIAESGFILGYDSFFTWRELMPFKGVDFYRIDDLLTDEERMVRDTVRRFVDDVSFRSSTNISKRRHFPVN